MFASPHNAMLPVFCSETWCPQVWAVDALSLPWPRGILYVFSPDSPPPEGATVDSGGEGFGSSHCPVLAPQVMFSPASFPVSGSDVPSGVAPVSLTVASSSDGLHSGSEVDGLVLERFVLEYLGCWSMLRPPFRLLVSLLRLLPIGYIGLPFTLSVLIRVLLRLLLVLCRFLYFCRMVLLRVWLPLLYRLNGQLLQLFAFLRIFLPFPFWFLACCVVFGCENLWFMALSLPGICQLF